MSSVFRANAGQLLVLASLSGTAGALGCSKGFSSCLELATCGRPAGESGAAGDTGDDGIPGGGGQGGTSATSGQGGALDHGDSGDAGMPGSAGRDGDAGADAGGGGAPPESAGGQGGAAGEDTPECEDDAACDDGLECNGVERCVEGACEAGEPLACVSDAPGCEATCEERESGPRCVTRAADADADGHGSSLCEAFPGDDCNDDDPDVYAGAPELCDALDNDCDVSVDLSDGLSFGGASTMIEGFSPSLAWSEHQGEFGVIWTARSDGLNQLRGGTLSMTGVLEPWPVISLSSSSATYLAPSLAAITSQAGFAAVYQTGSRGGQLGHFAEIASDGTTQTRQLSALHTDITTRDQPGFVLVGKSPDGLMTQILSKLGDSAAIYGGSPVSPRIASLGGDRAVIWEEEGTTKIQGMMLIRSQTIDVPLNEDGASPDITPAGDEYAVAWSTTDGVFHQRLGSTGARACPGKTVALPAADISDRSVAIASTGTHSLVLVTDRSNGSVKLLRFDEECRLIDQAELASAALATRPSIAVGGGHVAACWSSGVSENLTECRVVPAGLCEGNARAER